MDRNEAESILAEHLARYRALSYEELSGRVGTVETAEVEAPSGPRYQLEVQFSWDGKRCHDVRVIGSVDDGGWRAFAPLADGFVKAPDGSFVDE